MIGEIGLIIVGSGFLLGIALAIKDKQRYDQLIKQIGKRKTERDYVFVNEESETTRCEVCGKEISREEFERERYGCCDECTDDLMTEEEEDVWEM